ncbi:hypothetical protein F4808DRAFT_329343 [Astrocystis sublimbata]|nr:hypothetical protein F4808DRAFT_329343 [Astrocystis sublimbata]
MAYAQPNMDTGDELSTLFSRNMTFQQPRPEPVQQVQQQPDAEPIKYSITQHYHHSAHAVHQEAAPEPQRAASVPAQTQFSAEQVLSQHGVDPLRLSAQQIELFKTGDMPQQLRLIELWQICPPDNSSNTHTRMDWPDTSVEQEMILAQRRQSQRAEEERQRRDSEMSMDGTPLTPVQTTDGHWVTTAYVEPYMMSGYEMMAQREYEESTKRQLQEVRMDQPKDVYNHFGSAVGGHNNTYSPATDPVYLLAHNPTYHTTTGIATDPTCTSEWTYRQQLENQYGAFRQMSEMDY